MIDCIAILLLLLLILIGLDWYWFVVVVVAALMLDALYVFLYANQLNHTNSDLRISSKVKVLVSDIREEEGEGKGGRSMKFRVRFSLFLLAC